MPFPEKVREQVRRKAAFRCCRCHEIGIDVHHIVPSSDGGSNSIDNAAPLCQNCHDRFGDNPKKRKEIRQMRDWWYEVAAEKWPTPDVEAERLDDALESQDDEALLLELRERIEDLTSRLEEERSPDARRAAANGLVTATRLGDAVYANVHCHSCGSQTGLSVGATACPNCGAPYP